ncbi:hypothetical protein Poli38472_004826 [Pythium oligandrum]|uniref:Uncharacterized protein n=1 Tax=Pythium oligandrum TaxID=41045 RepID=A0A8K1CCD3_PYTOL|nr:hypothetical protein Poli38472_004826 [Pythium oligandrum]|eukprot:TMW59757.1 hypothetical protein Poli38472_004826 [Pythium oligandrum]
MESTMDSMETPDAMFSLEDPGIQELLSAFDGAGLFPEGFPADLPSFTSIGALGAAHDAFQDKGNESSDGTSTLSEPSDAGKKPPTGNSTRKRMKQELDHLRSQVRDLEQHLETLQLQHKDEKPPVESQESALVDLQGSLWKRVARHQLLERQKSERRNAELRQMLDDQLKVAQLLEKVLKKQPNTVPTLSSFDNEAEDPATLTGITLPSEDPLVFPHLLHKVQVAYDELEDMCQRTGFASSRRECNNTQVHADSSNRLFLEVLNAKIVPFPVEATSAVAWQCLSQKILKFINGLYKGTKTADDTICAKSKVFTRVGLAEATMDMAIVTKRFDEPNRTVLVLQAAAVGIGSRDIIDNLKFVEKGWVIMRRIQVAREGNAETDDTPDMTDSTLIQVCMHLTPVATARAGESTPSATNSTLTDLMLAAFHENLGLLYQTIENLLMEEAISTRHRPDFQLKPGDDPAL